MFTGLLVPAAPADGKASSESTSYGAAELNYKQMNSVGENTIKNCSAVKDFGVAEDANTKHRSEMEDAWVMMDQFAGADGSAFFGLYDVRRKKEDDCRYRVVEKKSGRATTEMPQQNFACQSCICFALATLARTPRCP